jgi:hypothetical protein
LVDAAFAAGDFETAYNNIKNYIKVVKPLTSSSSSSSPSTTVMNENLLQATCQLPLLIIKKMIVLFIDNAKSLQVSS